MFFLRFPNIGKFTKVPHCSPSRNTWKCVGEGRKRVGEGRMCVGEGQKCVGEGRKCVGEGRKSSNIDTKTVSCETSIFYLSFLSYPSFPGGACRPN